MSAKELHKRALALLRLKSRNYQVVLHGVPFTGLQVLIRSGVEKLPRSSLKGVSNRALFAYKNGRFASRCLVLGIGFFGSLEKDKFVFHSNGPLRNSI